MRGKNKTRRLKLKRSKLRSLKRPKLRKGRKTKKRGGAKYKPTLKPISEENASGMKKRPQAKSPRKRAKKIGEVSPSPPPHPLSGHDFRI